MAQVLADHGASVKSVVQKGLHDQARLVMVVHPVLESRFPAAMAQIARAGRPACAAARDPSARGGVRLAMRAMQIIDQSGPESALELVEIPEPEARTR